MQMGGTLKKTVSEAGKYCENILWLTYLYEYICKRNVNKEKKESAMKVSVWTV